MIVRASTVSVLAVLMLALVFRAESFVTPYTRSPVARSALGGQPRTYPASAQPLRRATRVQSVVDSPEVKEEIDATQRIISVSEGALAHLRDLKSKQGVGQLYLRMGVRSGGCSGMSYHMDMIKAEEVTEEDHVEVYEDEGFYCVVDPKSLLYLFGLRLDYKDALIGGGFSFQNPNAEETCGCGKSFGV